MGGVEIHTAYRISRVKCQQIFYVYLSLFFDGGKCGGFTAVVIFKREEACLYHWFNVRLFAKMYKEVI